MQFDKTFEYAIAINLGATTCSVAVFDQYSQAPKVIHNELGYATVPSYIFFKQDDSTPIFGEYAKFHAQNCPKNAIHGFTRMLGKKFDDSIVQEQLKRFSCKIISEANKPVVAIHSSVDNEDHRYTFDELVALMLNYLRSCAENHLGERVTKCVITISTLCTEAARQAVIRAASSINLQVLRIVNQASAAAISYQYALKHNSKRLLKEDDELTALIIALSGGCLTTSVCTMDKDLIEVKATKMNETVGGEDLDNCLVDHVVQEILSTHKIDLTGNSAALSKLRVCCEAAKKNLSTANSAFITVDQLHAQLPKFQTVITRATFEKICDDKFTSMTNTIAQVVAEAKLAPSDITDLVLIGASCQIPRVQEAIQQLFIGLKVRDSLLPDNVVVQGAATLAALLSGQLLNVLLVDVTPLSLGVETVGGAMTIIVPHNSTMPCKKTLTFATIEDNQTSAQIRVLEGEHIHAKENSELLLVELKGLKAAPKGETIVHVTFSVHANGSFQVTAESGEAKLEVDVRDRFKLEPVEYNENAGLKLKVEFV